MDSKNIAKKFFKSMNFKLITSFGIIMFVLIISAVITLRHFKNLNDVISGRINANIDNFNMSTTLVTEAREYNFSILAQVGDADEKTTSDLDAAPYRAMGDSIINLFVLRKLACSDSLAIAYREYMNTADQLDSIMANDFQEAKIWYFGELQQKYKNFLHWQQKFNKGIKESLSENSDSVDDMYYSGIIPSMVSEIAGLVLIVLLLMFILIFYVRPLTKMRKEMNAYINSSHPYTNTFEGDDELQDLNTGIRNIIDENITLKNIKTK